jgi:hypothetical protein
MPGYPGFESIEFTMTDSVGIVRSPFTPSSVQTQAWPGADGWRATVTLPKMNRFIAAPWRAWMAELRGMQNVFQLGDPICTTPSPLSQASGTPLCASGNSIASTELYTSGWTPSVFNQLMPGDYIQIEYRLYMVCEAVNSDSDGNATVQVWPSLREDHPEGTALVLSNTQGVFRLSQNTRTWHLETSKLLSFSFQCEEVR